MSRRTTFLRPLRASLRALVAAALLAPLVFTSPVSAQGLTGRQTQGTIAPIPLAIPEFAGNGRLARDVADVITADLAGSGLFIPLDRGSFIQQNVNPSAVPTFANWTPLKAQALVVGSIDQAPDGRVSASFRLWDVYTGRQLVGQRFTTSAANWRRLGHMIADRVYQRLTGESGYFDTRVVFVHETGPKDKRVKRLAMMDQDGYNVRMLTDGRKLVLTPRFSPTRQEVAYMSYKGRRPQVHVMDLTSGKTYRAGNFDGVTTFAPRFSPDGRRLVMSTQTPEGLSSIAELDLASGQSRALTQPRGIDTGPCYSPDGRSIVFESDREGSQQLYVMSANGGPARRISYGQGRYSTPVWSPRGDLIAFTKQAGGRFLIGVMRPDGSGERILTEGYHNEGPTWSPNGRVLMFFRDIPGARGGPRLHSVDLTGYNEKRVRTPSFASDPAWSPLLR